MADLARDPVNQDLFALRDRIGLQPLGLMTNQVWYQDPKRMVFTLSRYKFVAKMFKGLDRVLEVGCGDGFAARIVRQEVGHLTITDFDPLFIADAKAHMVDPWVFDADVLDILAGPHPGRFDAVYSLDVMEHIDAAQEETYLENMKASLSETGTMIIGMPSLESQGYASPASKEGHVNCKTGEDLRRVMLKHFQNVLMFSMNDEVVHTGFFPMAHYLFAIGIGKRD